MNYIKRFFAAVRIMDRLQLHEPYPLNLEEEVVEEDILAAVDGLFPDNIEEVVEEAIAGEEDIPEEDIVAAVNILELLDGEEQEVGGNELNEDEAATANPEGNYERLHPKVYLLAEANLLTCNERGRRNRKKRRNTNMNDNKKNIFKQRNRKRFKARSEPKERVRSRSPIVKRKRSTPCP